MCTTWSRGVGVLFGLDCLTYVLSFNVLYRNFHACGAGYGISYLDWIDTALQFILRGGRRFYEVEISNTTKYEFSCVFLFGFLNV